MTPPTDRERLDAIRQLLQEDYYPPELVVDVAWLLSRLAALAHERDELPHSPVLQAVLDAIKGTIDTSTNIADHPNVKFAQMERLKLEKRAAHAEAALLSLQTAIRAAALLPDPVGTDEHPDHCLCDACVCHHHGERKEDCRLCRNR